MDDNFIKFFENEEARIKASLASYIKNSLCCSTTDFVNGDAYKNFKSMLVKDIITAAHSKEFETFIFIEIEKIISDIENKDTTFKELLPEGFENNIKVYLYNNSPALISEVKKAVRNKDTEKRIKLEINKFVSSLNPVISKFVNADNLYLKLVQGIENYFNSPDSGRELVENASRLIDKGMYKEIKNVTMYFPYEGKKSITTGLRDAVLNVVFNEEAVKEFLECIDNVIMEYGNIYNMLFKFAPNVEELITKEAEEIYEYIKSN